jgi:hypothetical protein
VNGPAFATEAGKWSNDNPPMHDDGGLYANHFERGAKPIRLVERLEFDVASVDPRGPRHAAERRLSPGLDTALCRQRAQRRRSGYRRWDFVGGLQRLSASTDRGLLGRAAMSR